MEESSLIQSPAMQFSDENRLDLEFRQILCIIKRYIPYVNSNYQLSLYRSWLERLSIPTTEKEERNRYLLELARQIKSNIVSPPFDRQPPPCSLRGNPLNYYLYNPESPNISNKSNFWALEDEFASTSHTNNTSNNYSHCYVYPSSSSESTSPHDIVIPQIPISVAEKYYYQLEKEKASQQNRKNSNSKDINDQHQLSNNKVKQTTGNDERENIDYTFPKSSSHTKMNPITVYQKTSTSLKQKRKKHNLNDSSYTPTTDNNQTFDNQPDTVRSEITVLEDSSWCDLTTDASACSVKLRPLGSGDGEKNMQDVKKSDIEETDSSRVKENQKFIQENDLRISLKDTNFISSDWKKTIEALQLRLTETLNQNNDLKVIIDSLKSDLKFAQSNKDQYEKERKRLNDLHNNKMESFKKDQEEKMMDLELSFKNKLLEAEKSYYKQMDDIKSQYEETIEKLKVETENCKKEKEIEIKRLSDVIREQCTRMSNEISSLRNQLENTVSNSNSEEKVFVLQKCVSKMDRLFHKSEREYMKQIEKLKQELEMKDRITQIQLRTQRTEIIAQQSEEKQKQFDDIINNLEVKYIKMLEFHENQVAEHKRIDDEKIIQLKNLLDENNIPYNI